MATLFDWDPDKDAANRRKHGVSFEQAQLAFLDPDRLIASDDNHSVDECRFYCFGKVAGSVMTVRFTFRGPAVRIIGAGYWRKGKRVYERKDSLYG